MLVQRTAPVPGVRAVGFDFKRTCRAQLRALIAGYCGKFKVSCTLVEPYNKGQCTWVDVVWKQNCAVDISGRQVMLDISGGAVVLCRKL